MECFKCIYQMLLINFKFLIANILCVLFICSNAFANEHLKKIDDLIKKHGKYQIADFIRDRSTSNEVTVQVENNLYLKYGRQSTEYITIRSIKNDLIRLNLSVKDADTAISNFIKQKIENLIKKHGRYQIVDFIQRRSTNHDITVQIDNKFYLKVGRQPIEDITICSIINDLKRLKLSDEIADIAISNFIRRKKEAKESSSKQKPIVYESTKEYQKNEPYHKRSSVYTQEKTYRSKNNSGFSHDYYDAARAAQRAAESGDQIEMLNQLENMDSEIGGGFSHDYYDAARAAQRAAESGDIEEMINQLENMDNESPY